MARHAPRLWLTQRTVGHPWPAATVASLLSWPVLIAGLAGMWLARREWRRLLPLYLTIVSVTGMYLLYTPEARYTLPARWAMLVFVTYALFGRVVRENTPLSEA